MIYPKITQFLEGLPMPGLPDQRQKKWEELGAKIQANHFSGHINFICTQNARRSILSQSLATVLAFQNGFYKLNAWSGGADETYVHPNTIEALIRIGFKLESKTAGNNPRFLLSFADEIPALELFSKKYDDESNPELYHAIFVCSKGDAACPFIPDVASRTLIPFEDPGQYDSTEKADAAYDSAASVIAQELKNFFLYLNQLQSQ